MSEATRRIRTLFTGIVQGVGFRPFLYRVATKHRLGGFVCNTPEGVIVEVEGPAKRIEKFSSDVLKSFPPAADVSSISSSDVAILGESDFRIVASEQEGKKEVLISPDIATCADCLRELNDPADRRFRYPFINCTNCGPRLTIIRDVPYDRANTSMACFALCPRCRAEYEDPADRRFHAEPNACPVCGPGLWITDETGAPLRTSGPPGGPCQKGGGAAPGGTCPGHQGSRRLSPRRRRHKRRGREAPALPEVPRGKAAGHHGEGHRRGIANREDRQGGAGASPLSAAAHRTVPQTRWLNSSRPPWRRACPTRASCFPTRRFTTCFWRKTSRPSS